LRRTANQIITILLPHAVSRVGQALRDGADRATPWIRAKVRADMTPLL
jgi:hypothetical protein